MKKVEDTSSGHEKMAVISRFNAAGAKKHGIRVKLTHSTYENPDRKLIHQNSINALLFLVDEVLVVKVNSQDQLPVQVYANGTAALKHAKAPFEYVKNWEFV